MNGFGSKKLAFRKSGDLFEPLLVSTTEFGVLLLVERPDFLIFLSNVHHWFYWQADGDLAIRYGRFRSDDSSLIYNRPNTHHSIVADSRSQADDRKVPDLAVMEDRPVTDLDVSSDRIKSHQV